MSKNILKSSYVVIFMTMLSRITGFIRELVFASIFGASVSPNMDAFLVAYRIPNLARQLFAEGAFSQSFVPTLSEYHNQQNLQHTKTFINHIVGNLSIILFVITAISIIAAPLLIIIFAPGYIQDHSRLSLATTMLRIISPYLLLISLTACCSAILNSYDNFIVPAFTPVLLNLAMIAAAIFLAPYFSQPIIAAAWGVFIGGILQLASQLPFLKKINLLPKPQICWKDEGVRKVIKLMGPAIIGVSMAQLGFIIDLFFASFLRQGSIAWLNCSNRLTGFPLGVFGVAIATVILPHLSRKHTSNSQLEYSASMDWALRCILLIGLPSAIGILMLSSPLLITFFEHGKFNTFDVIMTSRSLIAFAIGIPSFMLVKVLAVGFYSKQNIKTPVKIASIAIIANIICNCILIFPLAHAGLALATSITSSLNAGCLWYILLKKKVYTPQSNWAKYLTQLGFASTAMAAFLWFTSSPLQKWTQWDSLERIWHLGITILLAGIIFLLCLFISGIRYKDFKPKTTTG